MVEVVDWVRSLHLDSKTGFMLAVALAGVYFLLTRRPKVVRDVDNRFKELKEERSSYYRGQRPPS